MMVEDYIKPHRAAGFCQLSNTGSHVLFKEKHGDNVVSAEMYRYILYLIAQKIWFYIAEFDYEFKLPWGFGKLRHSAVTVTLEGRKKFKLRVERPNGIVGDYIFQAWKSRSFYTYWDYPQYFYHIVTRQDDPDRKDLPALDKWKR